MGFPLFSLWYMTVYFILLSGFDNAQRGSLSAPDFNRTGVCGQYGHRCVIAYAVYGDNHGRYLTGALSNAEDIAIYYPGWVARFYHDSTGFEGIKTEKMWSHDKIVLPIQDNISQCLRH